MLQNSMQFTRSAFMFCMLTLTGLVALAQDEITINSGEVESWFERNWMWVAGAVVFIILLALLTGGRKNKVANQRKTTTVIKDVDGNVKSVTTTEENL